MNTVAVTGSAGYIGSELVRRLSSERAVGKIVGLDRVAELSDFVSPHHRIDLADAPVASIAGCLAGVDVLFHLAAARTDWGLTAGEYEKDNVFATRRLIEAARMAGVRKWVYFGTVGVYGPSNEPIDESSAFLPSTDYGRTKAQAGRELLEAADEEEWALRVIRPSAVFSENQPENTNLYRLIEAILHHRFVLVGDGAEVKTTSYLHNVVDAALWLYDDLSTDGIKVFNYIDEPRQTTREMVDLIRAEIGMKVPLIKVPLAVIERPARVVDCLADLLGRDFPITAARIRKFCTGTNFDSSRIRQAGFAPRFSSREAMRRTVQWHVAGRPPGSEPNEVSGVVAAQAGE